MAKPPVPAKIDQFLARPNPAVIATVRPDGQPVSVPTWYLWEDGRVLVNMDESRKRLQYLLCGAIRGPLAYHRSAFHIRLELKGSDRFLRWNGTFKFCHIEQEWLPGGCWLVRPIGVEAVNNEFDHVAPTVGVLPVRQTETIVSQTCQSRQEPRCNGGATEVRHLASAG